MLKGSYRRHFLRTRLEDLAAQRQAWLNTQEADIEAHQLQTLRTRWREAIAEIPYYRQLVASGRACKDFASLQEYREGVPILTRPDLMDQAEAFQRPQPPDLIMMTAGSTGAPLRFGCFRQESWLHTGMNQWLGRTSNGMQIQDPVLLLWGHTHLLGTGWRGTLRNHQRRFKDWLMGYHRLDAYHLGPEQAEACYLAARRERPGLIIGYSTALDLWARHGLARGWSLANQGIRLIVACAETFPQEDSRQNIARFLGAPVIMEYGGVDFGVCAYEMRGEDHYRVFWSSHFLEIEGPGEGPLVVSNLTRRYLPLFRYRNGDEAEKAEVTASGGVRSLVAIRGRINDTVTLSDGKQIHSGGLFACIFQEEIKSIQLVRSSTGLKLRLVADALPEQTLARIRGRLADLHPELAACPVEQVADLGTNRAGKRRWILDEDG